MSSSEDTPTPILNEVPELSTDQSDPKTITDRYTVMDRLGQGGMGRVYTAHDSRLNKTVAIKILFGTVFFPDYWARFQREAKAASMLNHPSVVKVLDFGSFEEDRPFLAMEYFEGETLAELVEREGALDVYRALSIMSQLCGAMQHAHSKGVLHRDLKPSNILMSKLESEETARVLDFGIAKLVETGDYKETLTKTGQIVGSPRYMSPEQAGGETLDERTDIYSLGCVLFFMLTGEPPYTGQNPLEVINKHFLEPIPELAQIKGQAFPEGLQNLVETALAKDVAERFKSMKEFAGAIDKLQDSVTAISESVSPDFDQSQDSEDTKTGTTGRSSNSFLVAGVIALSLGLIAIVSIQMFYPGKKSQPEAGLIKKKVDKVRKEEGSFQNKGVGLTAAKNAELSVHHFDRIVQVSGKDSIKQLNSVAGTPRKDMEVVWISNTLLDEPIVQVLERFSNLETLRLINCQLDDSGLRALYKLNKLTDIHFYKSPVSAAQLKILSQSPQIAVVNFEEIEVSEPELEEVSKLKGLKALRLIRIPGLKPKGLDFFNRKPDFELVLSGNPEIPRAIYKYLSIKYGIPIREDTKSAEMDFAEAFSSSGD